MFGLFFLIIVIICRIAYMIKVAHDNHEWNKNGEELAKENGWHAYTLCDGESRYDMDTGKVYHIEYDDHGDLWKVYGKKKVENISAKQREKLAEMDRAREGFKEMDRKKYGL